MSTLTLRTGNANLRESSAICAPYLALRDDTNDGKGYTLREALANTDEVRRASTPQFVPSIPHKPKEVCGTICTQTVELNEGSTLRFLVMLSPPWGGTKITANLFVMARETAALRRLRIAISDDERLAYNHFEIVGRFELLTGEQAQEEGFYIDEKFSALSTRNKQRLAILDIEELEPEITRRKRIRKRRVRSDSGKKTVIKERARRRGLRLD